MRYLHNLWSYKYQNPLDQRYESEIAIHLLSKLNLLIRIMSAAGYLMSL